MNTELVQVKKWCDLNKLAINFSKTNFMIIKLRRKTDANFDIRIVNLDGSSISLERKDHIK